MILVLTGVSGVGKTTVAQELEQNHNYKRSISYTTREPRSSEIDGIDYNFISKANFQTKLKKNFFLEHIEIFNNFYGTAYESIEEIIKKNDDIIMCLTKEGYLATKKRWPKLTLGIYLLPPEASILKERIKSRNTNDIEERMEAIYSCAHKEKEFYEKVITPDSINKVLEKILDEIWQFKLS